MVYVKQSWENAPNNTSPISAERLSHLETQYDEAVATSKSYTDSKVSGSSVTSVNSKTGDVILTSEDIGAVPATQNATTTTRGILALATNAETVSGVTTVKAVPPSALSSFTKGRYERSATSTSGLGSGTFVGETAILTLSSLSLLVVWDGASWKSVSKRVSGTTTQRDAFTSAGVFSGGDVWSNTGGYSETRVGSSWVRDSLTTGRLEIMGTLKRDGATPGTGNWAPLNDSAHTALGFGNVSKGSDFLRINYGFTASKVVTFSATLDESLAQSSAKIAIGASVGLTYADLYFYFHNGTGTPQPQDPANITTAHGNVWIHGVFLA